ncbi:MAG: SDR family oxidoreductase [Deltaproteobacteria bacterium]|nr:SDR family oxidoreductase [Deltaproteobacteria bacterium]
MGIFSGKTAIVTGGASGIGRALAEELARGKANVILADVNSKQLDEVVEAIRKAGNNAKAVTLDVSNYEAVKKLVEDTVADNSKLDYIFNNAGIAVGGEARDCSIDDWRSVLDVNLYGVINGVASAYPIMVEQGSGHIINTASIEGLMPFPGTISYVASKYAVVGLSNTLRLEGADLGVKVSVVCPGYIKTAIFHDSKMINRTIWDNPGKMRVSDFKGRGAQQSVYCCNRLCQVSVAALQDQSRIDTLDDGSGFKGKPSGGANRGLSSAWRSLDK